MNPLIKRYFSSVLRANCCQLLEHLDQAFDLFPAGAKMAAGIVMKSVWVFATFAWFVAGALLFVHMFSASKDSAVTLPIFALVILLPVAVFLILASISILRARISGLRERAERAGFNVVAKADESFESDVGALRLFTALVSLSSQHEKAGLLARA